MRNQHVYEDDQATRLERIYTAPVTVGRRARLLDLLDLDAGAAVLAVGCGPGYEPERLAEAVGPSGRVFGVDISPDVVGMADERCSDVPQVSLQCADAAALPIADGSVDAAVASLVYEYAPDLPAAMADLYRVLRPGGVAGIISTDWGSTVWYASDRDRMDRVVDAWMDMYVNPNLGSRLTSPLRAAGFEVAHVEPFSNLETDLETYGGLAIDLIAGQVATHEDLDEATVEAWAADLRDVDDRGETFFNVTYYIYLARKPADEG